MGHELSPGSFSGGQSDLLGIHRLSDRKPSGTDPNLLDSDKIPIVSTDISSLSISLDSSVVRLVEAAAISPVLLYKTLS